MAKHLFLFTIGPVQSFIAQARKTQDLYAGSNILSTLIEAGMAEAQKHFGEYTDIFPLSKADSKPNRFLAEVQAPKGDLQAIGKAIEKAIADKENNTGKLFELAQEALAQAGIVETPPGFDEQIAQHLQMYWAFEEIVDDDYAPAYKKLEQLMGSVKNVRVFEQYHYQEVDGTTIVGEQGRKCSLDGENNALFFGKETNPRYFRLNGLDSQTAVLPKASQNEGLSAISFIKRYFSKEGEEEEFPSTAAIALMEDEAQANKDKEVKKYLTSYKNLFRQSTFTMECLNIKKEISLANQDDLRWGFDLHLLFEENLTPKNIPHDEQRNCAKELLPHIQTHFKTQYYALILFDGDQMGKWLSGAKLKPEYRGKDLKEFHQRFSGLLADFGSYVRKEILHPTLHNGQAVYAGGDDFLGFVNLHHLFEVMKRLRIEFDRQVNNELSTYKQPGEHLTFSAGIVIAHYKAPLSEVLKKARIVEKKAKKQGDRNAFALSVMKQSGEVQECVFKWDRQAGEPAALSHWKNLETVVSLLREKVFSNTFILNLTKELYGLAGLRLDGLGKVGNKAVFAEIKRLLTRSLNDRGHTKKIVEAEEALQHLWQASQQRSHANAVENFVHALHSIDFIQRKI